uniref:Cilia- and flagella-associated protein 69 ARM repeats domain-containing protein n=1 Tax=Mola mola TaxID=94237 RepID=A0A3Q4BEW3_MOLML
MMPHRFHPLTGISLCLELTGVAKVLNICAEKVKDHLEYVPILLPFLKEKASDEVNYAQEVIDFLGFCISAPFINIISQLLRALIRSIRQAVQAVILSVLVLMSMGCLIINLITLTIFNLNLTTDMNCALILKARGAEVICLHMNEADPSGQVLSCSSDILWDLLEGGGKEEVTAQLSSIECVIALKEAFLSALGYCDIQLTNDLLVITTLIAEKLNPTSPLITTNYFMMFPVKNHHPLVRNLKPNFSKDDMKRKKLLLNLLVFMSKDLAALQLYKEERVMLALLTLAKPPTASSERRSGPPQWSSDQQEELQLQALATLATIAPLMLEDYKSCHGNTWLLLLLDWCISQGEDAQDNGVGGGSKKHQLRHCIRVLRSVTSSAEESVNQDLCDQGTINQLLGTLLQMESGPGEDDVVTLEIKSDIQLILSVLCESDMHRKELFGSEGVEMAVHFLRKGSSKFYSGLGHNKLILTTVDCVWSCIVGCYTTEDYFLAKGGVCLLLDLLNSSPRCVHSIILATLLELCDNPNTPPHILSWRDDGGQSAPRLLLQLWREEEEELNVSRNQHGGIADPQRPILGFHQQEEIQQSFPANAPSAAVLELSENLRAKIYSIFCKLGFQDLPELATTHYVTLSIVRRYLDFKVGEVWEEVRRELSLDGVRPTTPDEEALSTIRKTAEDTARKVTAEQNGIVEQREKQELSEEGLMYTESTSMLRIQLNNLETYMDSFRTKPKPEDVTVHQTEVPLTTHTDACAVNRRKINQSNQCSLLQM